MFREGGQTSKHSRFSYISAIKPQLAKWFVITERNEHYSSF
jgi:hypothetical protein